MNRAQIILMALLHVTCAVSRNQETWKQSFPHWRSIRESRFGQQITYAEPSTRRKLGIIESRTGFAETADADNNFIENIDPEDIFIENYRFADNLNPIDTVVENFNYGDRTIKNEELESSNMEFVSQIKTPPPLTKRNHFKPTGQEVSPEFRIVEGNEGAQDRNELNVGSSPLLFYSILQLAPITSPRQLQRGRIPSNSPVRQNGRRFDISLRDTKDVVLGYAADLASSLPTIQQVKNRLALSLGSEKNSNATFYGTKLYPKLSSDVTGGKHSPETKEQIEKTHRRGTRAVNSATLLSNCHSQHLHKCGTNVIQKFNLNPNSAPKCKIREEFLDCMVKQREIGCYISEEDPISAEHTNSIRSQVKQLLWSVHGCLLF